MHLAIVQALLPRQAWKDPEALVFGALLPDAMPPGSNSRMSHFVACQRGMRCYDLKEFRRLYGDKLAEEAVAAKDAVCGKRRCCPEFDDYDDDLLCE